MNNDRSLDKNEDLFRYQREKFQGLLAEIVECCESRTAYLSEKFSLPQAEVRCLQLFVGERYLTVKEISKRLGVAKSRVTKLVEGLSRKDLVHTVNDPEDARIRLISLTRLGKRTMKEIGEFNAGLHQRLLLELGPEERKAAISALELLRSGMEAIKERMI